MRIKYRLRSYGVPQFTEVYRRQRSRRPSLTNLLLPTAGMQSVGAQDSTLQAILPESQVSPGDGSAPDALHQGHGREDDAPGTPESGSLSKPTPTESFVDQATTGSPPAAVQQSTTDGSSLSRPSSEQEPEREHGGDEENTPVSLVNEDSTEAYQNGELAEPHEDASTVTEISPPTPPTKTEEGPDVEQEADGNAPLQEVTLGTPPPPVEKSPLDGRYSENPRNSVERTQSPRPSMTARFFGRKSTSDTIHSPSASSHNRNLTMSQGHTLSVVLISSALETIAASREAKRSAPLKEAVDKALNMIKSGQGGDKPREIFEPLRLACETGNEKLQIASLDCISKLISYSFFLEPGVLTDSQELASPPASPLLPHRKSANESQASIRPPNLVDIVTHTITACHTETAPDTVSLQIVKALLSLVLSPTILVHQSSLLKAVRTVYNIFLLSPDPVNQTIAQGGLTQMVHHVFTRCNIGDSLSGSMEENSPQSPKPDGMGHKSRSSSQRPSLTPSTPETYPVPPLTPPNGPEEEASQKAVRINYVDQAVAEPSIIQEVDVQSPGPGTASLYVHISTDSGVAFSYVRIGKRSRTTTRTSTLRSRTFTRTLSPQGTSSLKMRSSYSALFAS